jgi:hypothetical protein
VTAKRKSIRVLALAALAVLAAGCGGINARHSISPASFLLPGLLKADPPPAQTAPADADPTLPEPAAAQLVAQVR